MGYALSKTSRAFVLAGLGLMMTACGDDTGSTPACDENTCNSPPEPLCSGDRLITHAAAGTCNDAGQCEYATVQTDCSASGGTCVDGRCLSGNDACGEITCDTPPADECDGDTAITYASTGSCAGSGVCDYESTRTDCSAEGGTCSAGACTGAPQSCTESQECDNPPADFCGEDDSLNTYADTGSCEQGVCVYTPTAATCETGGVCEDGACVPAETDPCEGIVCNTPPETTCDDGGSVLTFIDVGICDRETGDCRYAPTRTECDSGDICLQGECIADPGPCGGSCNNPPEGPACDEDGLVTTWVGECNAATTECDYAPVTSACDEGLTCLSGRCVNPEAPCDGVVCDAPPADDCDGNNVQTWTGSCNPSTALCEYGVASSVTCEGDLRCDTGVCVDRCADTVCTQQPDFCADAATAIRFSDAGICDIETGTCDDSTVRSEVVCPTGSVCDGAGLCRRSWAAGDIIITEWLRDPQQGGSDPEWFEVLNTTSDTLDLRGLVIKDDAADQFEVTESVVLAPGDYAVFARTEGALAEGGTPDFVYGSGMTLSNSDDEIVILAGELEITAVRYTAATYPSIKGATNSVDPASATPADYSDPANWCAGLSAYDSQPNRGTPGTTNEACDNPCRTLDCSIRPTTCLDATTLLRYTGDGVCDVDAGSCDYAGATTTESCDAGTSCQSGVCVVDGADIEPGDLVITEFAASFSGGIDSLEWFEVLNTTDTELTLTNLVVSDESGPTPAEDQSFTIETDVTIGAGEYLVFESVTGAAGTVSSGTYEWGGSTVFRLDAIDQIILTSNGTEIDRVDYDDFDWPSADDVAAQFVGTSTDDNNDPAFWCAATAVYNSSRFGTPGAANTACAPVGPRGPLPTELVITEFMADPTGDDAIGEWIELYNATDEPLSLQGVRVTELDVLDQPDLARGFVIETPLVIEALSYVVLARTNEALGLGQTPDYAWNNAYGLTNASDDEIVLYYNDAIVDVVAFGPGLTFEISAGVTESLSATSLSTSLNDDPLNWCSATSTFGTGDFGSPGEANPDCDAVLAPSPAPGELVITEVMANSQAGSDDLGEFVELYHRGTEAISLDRCTLNDGTNIPFPPGTILTPGEYYVIGKSDNPLYFGAVVPDIVLSQLGLSNSGDTITLRCGTDLDAVVIDSYTYASGSVSVGQSLQFAPLITADAVTDNDTASNWCLSPVEDSLNYANNGLNLAYGTPGAPNQCSVGPVLPGDASVWINEIHYDDEGSDENEGVEIAGPAGADLTGWSLVLYNGSGGAVYDTVAVTGTLSPGGDVGFLFIPTPDIQNGDPDGVALVNSEANVVLFLSYGGAFSAVGGPAAGQTSQDIGVTESSSTAPTESLQLAGEGCAYDDFTWQPPAAATPNAANNGQTFVCGPLK